MQPVGLPDESPVPDKAVQAVKDAVVEIPDDPDFADDPEGVIARYVAKNMAWMSEFQQLAAQRDIIIFYLNSMPDIPEENQLLQLQMYMEKVMLTLQELSNVMKKHSDATGSIIGNLK